MVKPFYINMLHLQFEHTPGHILHEDLTVLATTESDVAAVPNLFADMSEVCLKHGGIGLAANQVGLRMNLFFVTKKAKLLNFTGSQLVIAPQWRPSRDAVQYVAEGEGCLSLPDETTGRHRSFDVMRWSVIDAEWTSTAGARIKRRLRGVAAQVFQHEHDHLRGVTLTTSALLERK